MNKLNLCLVFLILFLAGIILLFLQFSGCGGDTGIVQTPEDYEKFQEWKNNILANYKTPMEFAQNSYTILKGFTYDGWVILNPNDWRDASAFEIWKRRLVNCVLMNNILKEFYPGGKVYHIDQPGADHQVYIWQNRWIISFSGTKGEVFDGWENYPYYQKRAVIVNDRFN